LRIFVGIPIKYELNAELCEMMETLSQENPKLRWSTSDKLHITLRFVGEIDEEKIKCLAEHLQKILANVNTSTSHLEKLITLPNEKFPRVFAAYIKPTTELIRLAKLVTDELATLDFEPSNYVFLPHVTLARIKSPQHFHPIKNITLPKTKLIIDEVVIYQSEPQKSGSTYTPLAHIKLANPEKGF